MNINLLRERDNILSFTVSELNEYIKNLMDGNRTLSAVTVKGEISNLTVHRSGHLYFSLKDGEGQIKAVMFRSHASRLKFVPESGMRVIAHGSVSVYTRDGIYQLYVSTIQPDGVGALYLAYEQLKEKLSAEGLFDQSHKKPIPRFPERIGVITSPTGAAVRDILNVTARRYPLADVFIYPALVQGDGAEATLIAGIDYLDKSGLCDIIIIGRGGGSIEDLWAFNSESLARRIFKSKVPIISAVGHETDFTICDFVSDLRAPTPSAAAELAIPDIRELILRLDGYEKRCSSALLHSIEIARESLSKYSVGELEKIIIDSLCAKRKDASEIFAQCTERIDLVQSKLKNKLAVIAEACNALSPLSVLKRGYTVVEASGMTVSGVTDISVGDEVNIVFRDGKARTKIMKIETEAQNELENDV